MVALLKQITTPLEIKPIIEKSITSDEVSLLKLGADDYLGKPFEQKELLGK